jgi:superfamily I DNA/RNA helicase/DNA polymerase III epsilon subunit-like protein
VHTPTPAQHAAITAPLGPVLVVAGPGAGKTFCLIGRIAHLVADRGFAPERICAVTFTNKAADELAGRLAEALGARAERVTRGTLHALCADILRAHGEAVGTARGFGIADEAYQRILLGRLGVRNPRRASDLLDAFARARLQGATLLARDADLLTRYLAQLRRRNLLDFDDLVALAVRLLAEHPEIARTVAARWDYLLVDESQDLDPAQYHLIRMLVAPHGNVFAVGDDEQSIFSWRGADPRILKRFAQEFGTAPIMLEQNRRCAKPIFERARQLIRMEEGLFAKDLVADRESPFPVEAWAFPDEQAETRFLLDDLTRDRAAHGLAWGDYAILYRRHETGNALEGALMREGIPCRLARGRALQEDEVAGLVIAALRLMRDPSDPILLERFAQLVLPEALVERVRLTTHVTSRLFLDALRVLARAEPAGAADAKKAWRFIYHVEGLTALYRTGGTLASLVTELLSQRVGRYTNALEDRHDELADPADLPAAAVLADQLGPILHGRARAVITRETADRVAVRGLLLGGGVTLAVYASQAGEARPGDVAVHDDPYVVFKALQLLHGRALAHTLTDYVAFDLETTDRDITTCEIVEVAAVRVRGGAIVDRYRQLVRPRVPVTDGARATHGYGEADLAAAPYFEQVWPAFRAFVGDDLLVAHNGLGFDVPVLRRMAAPLGGADELVVYDSLVLARALFPSGGSLGALTARFGIPLPRAHHALDDTEALVAVFGELTRIHLARARKAALVHLLDQVGLGLALGTGPSSDEAELLRSISRVYALGPHSDCLEFYEAERRRLAAPDLPPLDVVVDRLGGRELMERLRTERSAEQRYPETYARLMRLVEACTADTLAESLERLLERVALSTSEGVEAERLRVNLLTLHATKGLEFSRVYVVGVEDYELPGYYQTVEQRHAEISEARRLLYVGMTRARDRLLLTRVDRRGGRDRGGNRFLDEMGLPPRRPG